MESFITQRAKLRKKIGVPTKNHSILSNFVRILSFSLYKGSLGNWKKTGLRFGNRTQFHILL